MEERTRSTAGAAVPLELGALYEAYADMIYRLALVRTRNRADAEDVLQDVFFRCLRRQPEFKDEEHQKAWLITAAIRSSSSLLTRADRRHGVGAEALDYLNIALALLVETAKEQTTAMRHVVINTSGSWGVDPVRPDLAMCSARISATAHQKIVEVSENGN